MKLKSLLLVAIFSVLAALTLSQSKVVSAQVSPIPVDTAPVTYFTYHLKGRVVYRLLDGIRPAANVVISARNVNSNRLFYAQTSAYGYYYLTVRQTTPSASYVIAPVKSLADTVVWTPAEYDKVVSSDLRDLNFVGIPISSGSATLK